MYCETQMPPMMANSKDGQGHKDEYPNTSRKILTRNAHVQHESSHTYHLEVMTTVNLFKNRSNFKVKRFSNNRKILSQRHQHSTCSTPHLKSYKQG